MYGFRVWHEDAQTLVILAPFPVATQGAFPPLSDLDPVGLLDLEGFTGAATIALNGAHVSFSLPARPCLDLSPQFPREDLSLVGWATLALRRLSSP